MELSLAARMGFTLASLFTLTHGTAMAADPLELAFQYRDSAHVIQATSMVQEPQTKVVVAGDDVVFTQRLGSAVAAVRQKGLQVRIFALPGPRASPTPVAGPIDDCFVYFTSVYPIDQSNDLRIQLISGTGAHWLAVSPDGKTVENGHYLLVFEIAGPKERVFRLRKGDAPGYFANGLHLVIERDNMRLRDVLAGLDAREGIRLSQASEFTRNTNTTPCYRYPPQNAAWHQELIAMRPCDSVLAF